MTRLEEAERKEESRDERQRGSGRRCCGVASAGRRHVFGFVHAGHDVAASVERLVHLGVSGRVLLVQALLVHLTLGFLLLLRSGLVAQAITLQSTERLYFYRETVFTFFLSLFLISVFFLVIANFSLESGVRPWCRGILV